MADPPVGSATSGTTPRVPRPRRFRAEVFTPARVTALIAIALVLVGLTSIRVSRGAERVSVPEGAKAGDLAMHPCTFTSEDGGLPADCGTLVVPENRNNASSRLIALPVTRIRSRSAHPGEPIFKMEGGPGKSNMVFDPASRYVDDRDVVLVGYRGADGSSVLDCPEVVSALQHSTDYLDDSSFRAYADGFRRCATRLTEHGVDLAGYSMTEQADDFEAARRALGYGQIDLVSESAGTRLAMIYAWRYPDNVRRSLMVGVNPPGHFMWDAKTADEQLAKYAALCAKDEGCRRRTNDLAATLRATSANMADRWWFFPIKHGSARIASFLGLFETTTAGGPVSAPHVLDGWLSASEGDASGLWFASVAGDVLFPRMFVWGEYAAIGFQDLYAVQAYYAAGGDRGSIMGTPATDFAWAHGQVDGTWPVSPDDAQWRQVRTSNVETLLVGGDLDFSTPPQIATRELLPYLPNGKQVILDGLGHTATFWEDQKDANQRLVNTFLATGQIDSSLYKPGTIDFSPDAPQTTIAKLVAVVLITFALVALLSLAWWMPRKVHKRGRFGPKSSAVLRSLFAVVLGLGGWFVAVLIMLTTMPGVRIDNELMAILSVGLAVGAGVFWAWLHRDWATETKLVGLAAALVGGLAGAWFGYAAVGQLLGPLLAIPGAVALSNLALIVFDVWRASTARERADTTLALDVREGAPADAAPVTADV